MSLALYVTLTNRTNSRSLNILLGKFQFLKRAERIIFNLSGISTKFILV